MSEAKPTTIVIFGASGDLTRRKLIPALFNSYRKGRLPAETRIVGFARRPWSDEEFRALLRQGMNEFAPDSFRADTWPPFVEKIHYLQGNLDNADDYDRLRQYLVELAGEAADHLYYLATAPRFFVPIVEYLGAAGLVSEDAGWRRVVIEKPFGRDLASAQALNDAVHAVFDEHQVYRIDHYLGKETAQNILFFRFANTIFEPVWNRNHVDNLQITVTESVDVGHRAGYYDQAGVLRDMFQNHLLQLLSLVAMEPPASFEADAVRNEKNKLLRSIRPIDLADTVRAQYAGYREVEGVANGSETPTFAALRLHIDNWRWQGVPIYLRSGKSLAEKATEIIIEFEEPPHLMFDFDDDSMFEPNILSICIQPDEGIHLRFVHKVPDSARRLKSVEMDFHYQSGFEGQALPDAYERLLLDAIQGDASLFTRSDSIEVAWQLIDPVLNGWKREGTPPVVDYDPGSWGPAEADDLLAQDGRVWRRGCAH